MAELKSYSYHTIEKYFFYLIVLLNLFPLLSNQYWVTMDGAAHVYNSTILKNILIGDNWFSSFYEINKELVPNWFGHFVLIVFKLFFSGEIADKLFLLSYGIFFPFSFRYLIRQIAPHNILLSYLIVPFTYTFVFTMGFYNFCFSLVFLFFVVGYFIKNNNSFTNTKKIILAILLILCYFSHLFSFISTILILCLFLLFNFNKEGFNFKENIKQLFKKYFVLFYCAAIPLFLSLLYFYKRHGLPKNETYISPSDLTKELYDFRALFSYAAEAEQTYNRVYLAVFLAFFIYTVFLILKKIIVKQSSFKHYFSSSSNMWILMGVIFILMYYKMPDSDGYAGYISVRLAIMIYVFMIILFTISLTSNLITFFLIFVFLGTHFMHLWFKNTNQIGLNEVPVELSIIEKNLPEHSIVYPVNMSGNWLAIHFSNYLAANKPILVLDNYEASNNYFPVKWKPKPEFNWTVGSMDLYNNGAKKTQSVDYILVHGTITAFQNEKNIFTSNVFSHYKIVMVFRNFILFKSKK